MAIRYPRHTAAKRRKALAQADKEFARADMKRGKRKHISIRTSEIKERLELFQPREFSHGARSVEPEWARELARRIGIHGELDPVLVIRLGKVWVCVDGHHRIAAYRLRNHKKPIRCEWFTGTPTEAVDESMHRNKKDTLPVQSADRREEAWRRTLLKHGSKKKIAGACGIGTGTVAAMRRAIRKYEKDSEFAARVGRPLMETSWGIMLLAARDVDEEESDLDERAGVLARTIRRRLTDLLKRDPVITAHALAKYDRHLPRTLMDVWNGRMAVPASRTLTEPEMKKQAETLRRRADSIDAMLAERDKRQPEALAAAARKHEDQQGKQTALWLRTSPEKEEFEF